VAGSQNPATFFYSDQVDSATGAWNLSIVLRGEGVGISELVCRHELLIVYLSAESSGDSHLYFFNIFFLQNKIPV
jgi:hypothetical protein